MRFGFAMPGRGPLARPDVILKLAEKAGRDPGDDLTPTDLRGQLVMMERFAEEVRPKTRQSPRGHGRTASRSAVRAARIPA
jgi:hypothetical protein